MESAAEITLRYAITRRELWQFYWWMWRKNLWLRHTLFVFEICFVVLIFNGHWPPRCPAIFEAVLVSACVISFFVAFPQLAFKSDERTLIITARGLQTTIGKKAGSMSWDDVARIEDTGGFIYIVRKNLKALIIPCRAFESHQERADFLVCILKLRSDAAAAAVA